MVTLIAMAMMEVLVLVLVMVAVVTHLRLCMPVGLMVFQ